MRFLQSNYFTESICITALQFAKLLSTNEIELISTLAVIVQTISCFDEKKNFIPIEPKLVGLILLAEA